MAYTTQYIGSRYVPLFADPTEWNNSRTYEPLTIVLHEGNSYTSKQFVPVGIELTNEDFWAETGNYNAQVEQYRKDVMQYNDAIASLQASRVIKFNTVSDMADSTNLTNGDVCITLGFTTVNDGGGSVYQITDTAIHEPELTENKIPYGNIIGLQNNLFAILVSSETVYAEQLGCVKEQKDFDNSVIVNNYIGKYRIKFSKGTYYFRNGINLFNVKNAYIEGTGQSSDARSFSPTVFDFINATSAIAVNMAGAFGCTLKNINFYCGVIQSICLYMDTTSSTPYSQYNSFIGCTFRIAENAGAMDMGSVAAYLGEAELTKFDNCVFVGSRPIVITLNDINNARSIGNGTASPHHSTTYINFINSNIFISYNGIDIITLEGTSDINFGQSYTQFYPGSVKDIDKERHVVRFCSKTNDQIVNICGTFISEENRKYNNVIEFFFDNSLHDFSSFNNNIKAICPHSTSLGLKITSYVSRSNIEFTGDIKANAISTKGSSTSNCIIKGVSNVPSTLYGVLNSKFIGFNKEVTDTTQSLGLEFQWSTTQYVKYAFETYLRYDWGKPTITNVHQGTISINTKVHSNETQPIGYVFINGEWKELTAGRNS